MKTRKLEKIGVELPLLGFGCMRLPLNADGSINKAATEEMVEFAMKNGVNYFDTAYMYHGQKSEGVMGEILKKYPRESFMLTTKLHPGFTEVKADVERIFEEQLKRCQTDYFDFYLIHDVDRMKLEKIQKFEIYEFLKSKQAEGKIKHIGISSHDDHDFLEKFLDMYELDFVQIQVNYVDWKLRNAEACYKLLEDRGIPCVVMEPVKGGSLAAVPDSVRNIFKTCNPEASPASFALRWVASLPNVRMVLSGMSNIEQLMENVKLMSSFEPLSETEQNAILDAVVAFNSGNTVPCTTCRYCMDCPAGVNIPGVFNLYNRQVLFGNREHYRNRLIYGTIYSDKERGSACVACGKCVEMCPQHIDIPNEIKKADEELMKVVNAG